MNFVCGEVVCILCVERFCDFFSLTHLGGMIYVSGGCVIFLQRGFITFLWRGCVIFFLESLHDFFVKRLHDFFLGGQVA